MNNAVCVESVARAAWVASRAVPSSKRRFRHTSAAVVEPFAINAEIVVAFDHGFKRGHDEAPRHAVVLHLVVWVECTLVSTSSSGKGSCCAVNG